MRIVSLNIQGWQTIDGQENLDRVTELLLDSRADIIGLNEVFHPFPTVRGPALDHLAEQLGMSMVFGACGEKRLPDSDRPTSYGNALLSRYPLLTVRTGLFRPTPGKERRGFLSVRLRPNDEMISITVTHLDHTDESVRLAQWSDLIGQFEPDARPSVIVGDFNCIHPAEHRHRPEVYDAIRQIPVAAHLVNDPDGPTLCGQIEHDGYVDSVLSLGLITEGSFIPASQPTRFDYIWMRSPIRERLTDAGVLIEAPGQEASDHRPVFADFFLMRATTTGTL